MGGSALTAEAGVWFIPGGLFQQFAGEKLPVSCHVAGFRQAIASLMRTPIFLLGLLLTLSGFGQERAGWQRIWADEFDQPGGTSPDTNKWVFDFGAGGWGNAELQNYTARTNNVRIENGRLIIEAHRDHFQGVAYSSGRIKTQGKFAFTYGRVEARIRIPEGPGIWPAFWMLGDSMASVGWPACGEIDIMENIGREPRLVHGTIHGPGYSGNASVGGVFALADNHRFAEAFHVYAVEWTPERIQWFVDEARFFHVTPEVLPAGAAWVFAQPQFLLLNLAVGGNWPGAPNEHTVFSQRMEIDYVRVYQPSDKAQPAATAPHNQDF